MCCCDGKTKGCGTCSRVFFTIFNILLIIGQVGNISWSLYLYFYAYAYDIYESDIGLTITIPCILILICSLGCSVSCCPNKIVLIIYSILMGILFVAHLIFYILYVSLIGSTSLSTSGHIAISIINIILLSLELTQTFFAILVIQDLKAKKIHPAMPTTPAIQYSSQADEQNQIKQNSNSIKASTRPATRYDDRADEENQFEQYSNSKNIASSMPAIRYDARADEENQIEQYSNSRNINIASSRPAIRYDARADEENQIQNNWTFYGVRNNE